MGMLIDNLTSLYDPHSCYKEIWVINFEYPFWSRF